MIKKILSVYSSSLVLGILGIITIPILLMNVGVEGYGIYAIYLTIASYFAILELGVLKHLIRLIAEKKTEIDSIISNFYFVTIIFLGIALSLSCIVIFVFFQDQWRIGIFLLVAAAVEYALFLPTKIYSSYSKAKKQFERLSIFNTISGVIRYTLIIVVAALTNNIYLVIVAIVLRRAFDVKMSKKILKININVFSKGSIKREKVKQVFTLYKESILLSATQALQINLNGMISLAISKMFGVEVLGVFRSIFDLLSKIWFFSNGLGMVLFSYYANNEKKKSNITLIKFSWLFYSIIFILAIISTNYLNVFALNQLIVSIEDAFMYLFLLISILLTAQGNVSYEFIQAQGKYKLLLKISILSNVIFLILAFLITQFHTSYYVIIMCWMFSILIQTFLFEYFSTHRNRFISTISWAVPIIWVILGVSFYGVYWIV